MKRLFLLSLSLIGLIFVLSACDMFPEFRASVLDKANKAAETAGYQYETTKMAVEKKVSDVEEAAKKVDEAAKKLDEATKQVKEATEAVKNIAK